MLDLTLIPPSRRTELLLSPLGEQGDVVVKDPCSGAFYRLGRQEHFLLLHLDGQHTVTAICAAFESQFGELLSAEDLQEFVALASAQGFLQPGSARHPGHPQPGPPSPSLPREEGAGGRVLGQPASSVQTWLCWRKRLFDPDRLFDFLHPKIAFLWTRTFLLVSLGTVLLAAFLAWTSRGELVSRFAQALRWETAVLVWVTLVLVTIAHEFAHGLTCKHHGGEVHEVGFLLLLLMPCFYCNVSDAWLFREKSRRLWVTFAGGYCDLVVWALAVLVWRLTPQELLINYLAWVVLSVCGVRVLFNFNPLLKLDGYYLLSDLVEVPNLQQRARDCLTSQVRRWLWGAPRLAQKPRGRFLFAYGLASFLFSVLFLTLMLVALARFLARTGVVLGLGIVLLGGSVLLSGLFQGFLAGEVRTMIRLRRRRAVAWVLILLAVVGVLVFPWQDRASSPFQLRCSTRAEIHAPVAGFLKATCCDEGDPVTAGQLVLRLEVPNLTSRIAQKRAEQQEVEAHLRLLEAGTRIEEVRAQRCRVDRALVWRDLARRDLDRVQKALAVELTRLGLQIEQHRAEVQFAQTAQTRAQKLLAVRAVAEESFQGTEKRNRVSQSQLEQAEALRRARQAVGCTDAETELARREKELAEAQSTLELLEAGTRPEEIDAERARLERVKEERSYLEGLQRKILVCSPVSGVVTTPRLTENIGRYYREGELICVVEEPSVLEVEIDQSEEESARVEPGQAVGLKIQAFPFETFSATVHRLAPRAIKGEQHTTVVV